MKEKPTFNYRPCHHYRMIFRWAMTLTLVLAGSVASQDAWAGNGAKMRPGKLAAAAWNGLAAVGKSIKRGVTRTIDGREPRLPLKKQTNQFWSNRQKKRELGRAKRDFYQSVHEWDRAERKQAKLEDREVRVQLADIVAKSNKKQEVDRLRTTFRTRAVQVTLGLLTAVAAYGAMGNGSADHHQLHLAPWVNYAVPAGIAALNVVHFGLNAMRASQTSGRLLPKRKKALEAAVLAVEEKLQKLQEEPLKLSSRVEKYIDRDPTQQRIEEELMDAWAKAL